MQTINMRAAVRFVAMGICLGLGACGGGGGGGPPLALGTSSFTTNENVALTGQLSATGANNATVTFAKLSNPTSGTITSFTPAGAFVYKPATNFTGNDTFNVQINTSAGASVTSGVMITVHANHAPVAQNDIERADGAALASINVLAKAQDPDGDPLTVTIQGSPLVGNATVNPNGTVAVTGLPSDFKGLTRFKYTVTDPSGATSSATAAIFVGDDPFRAVFVGDATGNGSPEVYLTDFAAAPVAVSAATQGTLRLGGFAASDNGATVVYRSQDTANAANTTLTFVQTAAPSKQNPIKLPTGMTPAADVHGQDQFRVSPDGTWIAVVAKQGSSQSLYILNVAAPTTLTQVAPAGSVFLTLPSFSQDSKSLFFLATSVAGGANKSLYLVALSDPGTTALLSAAAAPGSTDDVSEYSVSRDQSRILIEANRGGSVGFYYINPQHLQTEIRVSQPLTSGEQILESTINLPPGLGGSSTGDRIGYTLLTTTPGPPLIPPPPPVQTYNAFVAEVSSTPNPRAVATSGARVIGFRPDDAALLFTRSGNIYEGIIDSAMPPQLIGSGGDAWYDSTGNVVLIEQFLPTGGSPPAYTALAETVRGSFGTTTQLGTGKAAQYFNVSGFDRAVVLLGEGPNSGAAATSVQLALVNALAPTDLFYLSGSTGFQTPLQLTSEVAKIVSY